MKKKLLKNTVSSLLLQIITIICGLILPRMILKFYGSEVNGLVNSITQFLSIISFLELGIGAVVQSSLYKPLADNDFVLQSQIYVSAQRFFAKLAQILLLYVVVLIFIYPVISGKKFGFIYTAVLIVALSINSFAQYYFGIVNSLLLTADQKGYIQYNLQIITLLINTILSVVFIYLGCSIQFVKISTSIIYLSRPIILNLYVSKNYKIDKKIKYKTEPIKQKWNGIAQHVAAIVLDGTDTIVLTIFSDLQNVSIYSVYYLVVSGIKQLFNSVTSGLQSVLGDLYARKEEKKLLSFFSWVEWIIHTSTVFVMGCTICLITPFVLVYTNGIHDANYNQPLFGYLLVLAYAFYCLRLPYHMMIRASGKYKETQNNYIYTAVLNFVISMLLVKQMGLIGVAIGTLIAMASQVIGLARYNAKYIFKCSLKRFIKQMFIDLITMAAGILLSSLLNLKGNSFDLWFYMALKVVGIWGIVILGINLIVYPSYMKSILTKRKNK